ncbi:MAG: PEGA domain-containing protein [Myxococcales bacterium]|nr:PEGA domain-containing protein [Myxococcales bacterium]
MLRTASIIRRAPTLLALAALLLAGALFLLGCRGKNKSKRSRDARVRQTTCKITIKSVPSGAAVLFEGRKRLGHTPLTLERDIGHSYSLHLVKDGYSRTQRVVHFEGGPPRTVTIQLAPARAEIVIDTGLLRGVQVVVDGKELGRTPKRVHLTAGKHVLTLNKSGHHGYREEIVVAEGDNKKRLIRVSLPPLAIMKKPAGWLTIRSDAPALLYRGKKMYGSVPLVRRPLPVGTYRFTVKSSALGVKKTIKVKLVAGELVKVMVKLQPADAGP